MAAINGAGAASVADATKTSDNTFPSQLKGLTEIHYSAKLKAATFVFTSIQEAGKCTQSIANKIRHYRITLNADSIDNPEQCIIDYVDISIDPLSTTRHHEHISFGAIKKLEHATKDVFLKTVMAFMSDKETCSEKPVNVRVIDVKSY